MELEPEPTTHSLKKQKEHSPFSSSSYPSSEFNSYPFSPLHFDKEISFSNQPLNPQNLPNKTQNLQNIKAPNIIRKPPLLKKYPPTCPPLALKDQGERFKELLKKEGHSNQSTDNSVEIIRNSIENTAAINQDSNEFVMTKPKLILKNTNIQFKMNFPLKNNQTQGSCFQLLQKKSILELNNRKIEEFFESPNSVSQKYNTKKAKTNENSFFEKEFEKISNLGTGNFSSVFQCKHKASGLIYAIKITKNSIKTVKSSGQILNEAQLLAFFASSGNHPNIVKYYNSWIEEKELFIQMEFCESSLESLSKSRTFVEKDLCKILKDISSGLLSLHKNNVVHLDIKPENILFSKEANLYKIADLGLSRVSTVSKGEDIIEGDSRYLAHELLNLSSNDANDLTKADVFSLGISLYELMIKEKLPKREDEYQAIRKGNLPKLEKISGFSIKFKKIIANMMHPNFQLRPSCEEVLKMIDFCSEEEKELKWLRMKAISLKEQRKNMEVCLKREERKLRKRKSFS